MNNKIKYMNICVTNRCNLTCVMCDIWKERSKSDLSVGIVKKVLEAKCLDKSLDITLTGGELFLHKELWQLTDVILAKNPRCLKGISTNGTKTEDTLRFLHDFSKKLSPDFTFHISIDGINCHDAQRGESIKKIIDTIKVIRSFKPSFGIKVKFTITPVNYTDIIPTFKFCLENNLDFRVKLVEYAPNYTNRVKHQNFLFNDKAKKSIISDLRKVAKEKLRLRDKNALFILETIRFLQGKVSQEETRSVFQRVFLMPEGDVFTCIHRPKIGNLHHVSLDEIWASFNAEKQKSAIRQKECVCGISYHGFNPA